MKNFIIATIVIVGLIIANNCWSNQEPDWEQLVDDIIILESSRNPNKISKDNCRGLMQISYAVFKEYQDNRKPPPLDTILLSEWTFDNMFNSYSNIEVGTWYLKRIWFHYLPYYRIPQTIDNLLWTWNAGIGNVVKRIKPKETKNYIKKYHKLSKLK